MSSYCQSNSAQRCHTGQQLTMVRGGSQVKFGLSVDVPPDRALAVGPHNLLLVPAAAPTVGLTISFRGPIESVNIVRSGVAAGDIITPGTVAILGETVTRNVLVYQRKDKAI